MCLETVYYGKKKKAELAKLPDMVKCWKVVGRGRNRDSEKYFPPIYDYVPYKTGWNDVRPKSCCMGYWIAFHAFLNRKEAQLWSNLGSGQTVVQSKTAKTDIVAIGKQCDKLSIVTKRIWIPKPRKKKSA